jgi:hypothetical protein
MTPDTGPGRDGAIERVEVRNDTDEHLATTVVYALSRAFGCDPNELPGELNDVVDPDALANIFAPRGSLDRGPGRVVFEVSGSEVTVDSTGLVTVAPKPATGSAEGDHSEEAADD